MARSRDAGLTYFYIVTNFAPELEGVIIKNGNDALAVWLRIMQEMYTRRKDFIEATAATISTLAGKARVDPERFKELIREFAEENIFSLQEWLNTNKIVSHGVKKQLEFMETQRKQKSEAGKKAAKIRWKQGNNNTRIPLVCD